MVKSNPPLLIFLLLIVFSSLVQVGFVYQGFSGSKLAGNVIYVPDNYATIQEAINHANPGDAIIVRTGNYYESITVDVSSITLMSESDATTINGRGASWVIKVEANNVTIQGFTIINGIFGIYLEDSSSNRIMNNNITNNSGGGVVFYYSNNNSIANNNFVNNSRGMRLIVSDSNDVINNNFVNNSQGIYLKSSSTNKLASNNLAGNDYGMYLYDSSYNSIMNNNITNNSDGIYLDFSKDNDINNNNITNNSDGIYFYLSSSNDVINNNFVNNSQGIYLKSSGVWEFLGSPNVFFLNNFINNSLHVYSDYYINYWSSQQPIQYIYKETSYTSLVGNYWDDYKGIDTDGNGIGDSPYTINGKNVDKHPLMEPTENYIFNKGLDVEPPKIEEPIITPEKPSENKKVKVKVTVSDDYSGVENVTLWYRVNNGTWQSIAMVYNATTNQWEAEIPAQVAGTTVEYYIEAYDAAGKKATTKVYSYVVKKASAGSSSLSRLFEPMLIVLTIVVIVVLVLKKRKK